MKWAKIEVKVPEKVKEMLGGFLLSNKIEKWEEKEAVSVYLPFNKQIKHFLRRLVKFLWEEASNWEDACWSILFSIFEERDWGREWRKSFPPHKVGNRLVIKPPWADYEAKEGEIVLEIEPRSAFGTGEHPTTRLSLLLMERYIKEGDVVIDVGCGSGILSLAALLLGGSKAIGVDIDEIAIEESRENARHLGLDSKAEFQRGNLLRDIAVIEADIILCNIDLPSFKALLPYVRYYLKEGGFLIASGFTEEGYKMLEVPNFLVEVEREKEGDWIGVVWRRKSLTKFSPSRCL